MNSSDPENIRREARAPDRIRTLIIGYGNELRGDDGAGPTVARIIGDQEIPDVVVETCHQLLPEHAAKIAAADLVIFVDATLDDADDIDVRRIHPASHPEFCGHRCDPEKLLYWCDQLVSRVPQAWFIHIPGSAFEVGENLSLSANRHVRAGVSSIAGIIRDHSR
jgi:hydrogenase maturation protease